MASLKTVAVLGAGTMGAQIALHCANAGVSVLLMDRTRVLADQGLARARQLKPDPQFTPDAAGLITTGGFDADLPGLATADWIVEAIVEQLAVKQALMAEVDAHRRAGTLVTTNTSALSIAAIADGRSDDFRRHWMGTHFFNPPRYLRLLELVPTSETDPAALARMAAFADRVLGKGTVVARDVPGFIGNRLALHSVVRAIRALTDGPVDARYSIEEIDALTGSVLGRPGSATFRTMDLAGLDILAHVLADLHQRLPAGERETFATPPLLQRLVEDGRLGEKTGRGFYERRRGAGGESEIWVLDPETLDYRPKRPVRFTSVDTSRGIDDAGQRVRALFTARDRAGTFVRDTLIAALLYAARIAPTVAESIDDVDRVMRWGFGWELGPFELLDTIGVDAVVEAARAADDDGPLPPLVEEALASERRRVREGSLPPASGDLILLRSRRAQGGVVRSNAGASLVDLGDGVLAVEFHSKMNAIGEDTFDMLQRGVREAAANYRALVIGNDAPAFSAGANLMLLLLEAQEGNWDDIDASVRRFQSVTMGLRTCPVPVVVAPAGLALGGAVEIALHADRVQAAAETYMGLVEVGVGLIPAGGGTKEMMARAAEDAARTGGDLSAVVQRAFETIALAKTSTSGADAFRLGYLRPVDGVTMNRERLLADAKAKALARANEGYRPPPVRTAIPVGGASLRATLALGVHLAWRAGRASDHDKRIGERLARIMAGGDVPHATTVSESYLLDLERETFLGLLGEPKTLARIQHMLKTGKALRN